MKGEDSLSQWQKIELLGQGGNGHVWKASKDGVECALKVLNEAKESEESYRRFIDEVRILIRRALRHLRQQLIGEPTT